MGERSARLAQPLQRYVLRSCSPKRVYVIDRLVRLGLLLLLALITCGWLGLLTQLLVWALSR